MNPDRSISTGWRRQITKSYRVILPIAMDEEAFAALREPLKKLGSTRWKFEEGRGGPPLLGIGGAVEARKWGFRTSDTAGGCNPYQLASCSERKLRKGERTRAIEPQGIFGDRTSPDHVAGH